MVALEVANGVLTKIKFKSGPELERAGLLFSPGCRQASHLSQRLGCERDEKGGVVTDPNTEETSVPGVYVAGDVSRDVLLVSIAIAEGAKAAVAIIKAFLRRDGFAIEVALLRLNLFLCFGKPAPDAEHVNQEENYVLNDE